METLWNYLPGKRVLEGLLYPRRVKRRLVFCGTTKADLSGFAAMWETGSSPEIDMTRAGTAFAEDAYIRLEYIEMYDLIREEFAKNGRIGAALVQGSSGTGKSAFLQYMLARMRDELTDVLVVQGLPYDSREKRYLYLSTNWLGLKTSRAVLSLEEAIETEKECSWTFVDGCDWYPRKNCVVGASSPSTPWKGFRLTNDLLHLCMPAFSLQQLEDCATLQLPRSLCGVDTVRENYKLVGGIARWVLGTTSNAVNQVDSAVKGISFEVIQAVMATQHATKNDEKELVHRLVLWRTARDENGNWKYRVTSDNPIHYSLLTNFVSKELAKKAATLSTEKRKQLISSLKGESAASAYRGVIFEADAIDRLVCGGKFTLLKCTSTDMPQQVKHLEVVNTRKRYGMPDLETLDVCSAINRIIVPDARNFESVDAFLVKASSGQSEVLLFQMTVGESHPTKLKGVNSVMRKVRKDLQNNDTKCAVVFVVPGDVQDFYERPQPVLNNDGSVRVKRDGDFNDGNQYCLVIDYLR